MARVAINTGASANDGTGDNLRAAGGILNNNFLELYTYLGAGSTTVLSAPLWSSTNAGINTLSNVGIGTTNPRFLLEVGAVGASGTTLFVNGDARVTGIVTIGPASITLNGITNTANIGTSITLSGTTGIISATAIVLGGNILTGAGVTFITAGSGISINQGTGNVTITATGSGNSSQFVTTTSGIHTLSNVGIGTTNPTSKLTVSGNANFIGIVTATSFVGDGSGLTGIVGSGIVVKDSGSSVGTAGTIDFGANLSVTFASGIATITGSASGGSSQFVTTSAGIHTLSNVGIGTTNPTSALTVTGNGTFTGVVTATTFIGNVTGTATTATNAQGLTGTPNITVGVATASALNVGTGGTIITTTTAGLVGIGTTNPTSKLTVSGDVLVSDKIVAGLTSSIIPFYWENFSDLPSFNTYHGAFAHVHQTGKAYYAHTRWIELVHTEASGVVGTGTERYNVGIVTASTLNVGTGGTVITTTTAGLVGIGTTNPTSALTVGAVGAATTNLVVNGWANIGGIDIRQSSNKSLYIGEGAGQSNINVNNDFRNVAIGYEVLNQNTGGDYNVVIGSGAMKYGTGDYNIIIGNEAGDGVSFTGTRNIFMGDGAGAVAAAADDNTIIGSGAGEALTSGDTNIFIGHGSGDKITNGDRNTLLGSYTGNENGLDIRSSSNNVVLSDGDGNIRFYANSSGNVGLGTTNPTSKLTVSGDVKVTGIVTATTFSGSGSGLTNIPSGQLSGTLPAINGSALIGVVGSGSGTIIEEDGTPVGTAGTINFSSNLSVSFSSGIATIIASGGSSQFVTTVAGIHTLSNVGIGTTNPISKLQIERFGIQSGFGTFLASAGITTDIDIFTISSTNFKTLEYTLHFTNESNIQAQKVLIMQNGTTSYSQEYAIMFEPNQIVSIGTTISSGICKLQVTPETGISGITTYRFSKETLL